MPRKKDNDRIDGVFSSIESSLKDFTDELNKYLEPWLERENMESEDILKELTDAQKKASELRVIVKGIERSIRKGKRTKNSRFAGRVVQKFLDRS